MLDCSNCLIPLIQQMGEPESQKGKFNTSQSVPCGALLEQCCHCCCLGSHEGHRNPGGRGTGHRTHIIKVDKLAAGRRKASICSHQVPDHLTHIFQNVFAICSLPLLSGLSRLQSSGQLVCRMAP